MGSDDPAAVVQELDRALRGVPDPPVGADELQEIVKLVSFLAEGQKAIVNRLSRIDGLLDEFMPLVRAYLDPNQSGPRGAFMRRRIARMEGDQP